jgi:CBS-domain-containing membrane protein
MRAKDVMSDGVTSVAADATVLEAARMLVNCQISAAPVVDDAGLMVGIVSEADLLRPDPSQGATLAGAGDGPAGSLMEAYRRPVVDVMTRNVLTADEETTLDELARLMIEHRLKRIPIVRGGAVVGIVSRVDLLRALISLNGGPPGEAGRDEQLRRHVSAACKGRSWSLARDVDVVVNGGTVHLWGVAPSDLVRDAYRLAARNIPGVKAVQVHMHIVAPPATRVGL